MRAADLDLEQLYRHHFPLLVDLALSKNVPPREAHDLAHDILLATLLNVRQIDNLDAWLRGAMISALRLKGAA